ncbi:MAG TPA: DUF3486 family protein [Gammaproteobacteria bacterium]|nr:DUF3486 family protein [Gammaproteobacteria bacterium]
MSTENELNRLRRLRILQVLDRIAPTPMGEVALLNELQVDPQLSPTIEKVRQSLRYLGSVQLVKLISVEEDDWLAASLSAYGKSFLNAELSSDGYDVFLPGEKPMPREDNYRGRVSSINVLPVEVKAWLDNELIRLKFRNYKQLAQSLKEQGYSISKSAIGRYGKRFKEQQQHLRESIEQAKLLSEVIGGDGAAMNQALTALAQDRLMNILHDEAFDENIKLPDLIRSIASLNRSDINTRKFKIEQAARQKALEDAAQTTESAAIEMGMDDKSAAFIRNAVLGLK